MGSCLFRPDCLCRACHMSDRKIVSNMSPAISRPRVLIPVFLTVQLNSEVSRLTVENIRSALIARQLLNSFLEQALTGIDKGCQRLCVITNVIEASSTLEPLTPPIEVIDFPFVGLAIWQLARAIESQKKLTNEVFNHA